ncbi:MAG: hypothetical protein KME14_18665 [Tildeniella torsiva UHER 1998/13D]|jgi:hypothetical protein|nr:hypothetical protein [Tildeniella torsiva UHER 1998/13D]
MRVTAIANPFPNEHILAVTPALGAQTTGRRRLNFFQGRSLSHQALNAEQRFRAEHLALSGQQRSAGVVTGLEVTLETEEVVWVGDRFPAASTRLGTEGDDWPWVTAPGGIGGLALQSPGGAGPQSDGFSDFAAPWRVSGGDGLVVYVHLDAASPPSQIMVQWHEWQPDPEARSWEHRAYWGDNTLELGIDGTASRRRVGDLPTPGQWARLTVAADQVGLLGQRIDGIQLTVVNGQASWNRLGKASPLYRIAAGTGLAISGEDVRLPTERRVAVTQVPVYAPVEILAGGTVADSDSLLPRRLGPTLAELLEPRPAPAGETTPLPPIAANLPPVGVLVLQPVIAETLGNPDLSDPCEIDLQNLAFEEREQVDGTRLVFYPWPTPWQDTRPSLEPGDPGDAVPNAAAVNRWRNRLAYEVFQQELSQGTPLPWELLGVPIALVGFDGDSWTPLFCDRSAVVRRGGQPRADQNLVPRSGSPWLWQARIEQFAEQLTELDLANLPIDQVATYFDYLPPVGVLPTTALELTARRQRFFPDGYGVQALPVPLEQLDLVVQESAPLRAFSPAQNDASDQVQILVPVPQEWYEPRLLLTDDIDPEFPRTLAEFELSRAAWLHRRSLVRSRVSTLERALTGKPADFPDPDPDRLEDSELSRPSPPFSSTRAHQSALFPGLHQHLFENAATPLVVNEGDRLTTYVYLDPDHPPAQIMLQWRVVDWEHRAYWGDSLIAWGSEGTTSRRRIGDLPPLGQWVRLEIPAELVGLVNRQVNGMAFTLHGGRAAWGHSGKAIAGAPPSEDEVWVGADLPEGATARTVDDQWLWLTADELLTPFEERYEIDVEAETGGDPDVIPVTSLVRPIAALQTDLQASSPIDRDAVRLPLLNRVQVQVQLPPITPAFEVPFGLTSKLSYEARRQILSTVEPLTTSEVNALKALSPNNAAYGGAIDSLASLAQQSSQPAIALRGLLNQIPSGLAPKVQFDSSANLLKVQGVLSAAERDQLLALAPEMSTAILAVAHNAFRNAVTELYDQSQDNTLLSELGATGLETFITRLEALVDQADDQIEFGFLQVRTDMFRVRQFILGTEEATRLAVSPTIAAIAKGESAATIQKDLNTFFSQLKPPAATAEAVVSRASAPAAPEASASTQPIRAIASRSSTSNTLFLASAVRGEFIQPVVAQPIRTDLLSRVAIADAALQPELGAATRRVIDTQPRSTATLFATQAKENITQQSPLIGKVNQSIVVAERLQEPPAPEARNYTLAGQVSVVNNLAKAGIFKDLPVPGAKDFTFGQIKQRPGRLPVDPGDLSSAPDEAEYVASSVRVLDDTVGALRLAEGRVAAYRQAIAQARRTLSQVQQLRQSALGRLDAIAGELAEARHDVSVAKALLAEEQQRVNAINQRRQTILDTYVDFLVYHRPRTVALQVETPSRPLFPGLMAAAEPACLSDASDRDIPAALQEAVALLRDAPVTWFAQLPQPLAQLDRVDVLTQTLQSAKLLALQKPVPRPALQQLASTPTVYNQAIYRTVATQQQVVQRYRQQTAQLDLGQFNGRSWLDIRDRARQALSLGDLIDGNHSRSALSRAAAAELAKIARGLGCLYAGFSAVRPIIRLNWAERLSQYDAPVNLRNLTTLPRWSEIDYLDRQEMQAMADWLYQRLATDQPEAIDLLSDLVRVCILLASAAPVDQIIAGRVVEATPAVPGGSVKVAIDPAKVGIGMTVLMYGINQTVVAQGVVENLTANLAATRVVQIFAPSVQLTENTTVRFLAKTTAQFPAQAFVTRQV